MQIHLSPIRVPVQQTASFLKSPEWLNAAVVLGNKAWHA